MVERCVRRHADVVRLRHVRWLVHLRRMVHRSSEVLRLHRNMLCKVRLLVVSLLVVMMMRMLVRRRRQAWNADMLLLAHIQIRPSRVVAAPSSIHPTVPPVLHGIVTTTTQASRDLRPTLAHFADHLLDEQTLLWRDWVMVEVRLQVLVVTLAALFGRSSLDSGRDADPVVSSMEVDQV